MTAFDKLDLSKDLDVDISKLMRHVHFPFSLFPLFILS